MQINSLIDAYASENYYTIYKTEGIENISEADIILIADEHKNVKFQQTYQDFINLFKTCTVLVEFAERGKAVNHPKHTQSWKINPQINVKGWDDIDYMKFCREKTPILNCMHQMAAENSYNTYVKKDGSPEIISNAPWQIMYKEQEILNQNNNKFFPKRQVSYINSISDELSNGELPIIVVSGYVHCKITPNGYKVSNIDALVANEISTQCEIIDKISDAVDQLIGPSIEELLGVSVRVPLQELEEPEWKKRFHEVFSGKKIVLLINKPFIKVLSKIDEAIDRGKL